MSARHLRRTLTFSVTSALLLSGAAACSGGEVRDDEQPVGTPESEERTDQLLPEERSGPLLSEDRPAPHPITNVAPVLPPQPGEPGDEGGEEGEKTEGEPEGQTPPPKRNPRPEPPSPDDGKTVNPGPNEL